MTQRPIAYYALCRDQARIEQWQARAAEIPDVEFHFWTGFQSMYAFILKAIEDCPFPFLVVAHDDVVIGRDFAVRVRSLVDELDGSLPNWGVVGNAGVGSDGKACVYVKDPWCIPQRAHGPDAVACVDGNLMLINRHRYIKAECEFPDLGGFHGYDVVLSLECLRKGLLVLTDGRLRAVHLSGGSRGVYGQFIKAGPFQQYFQDRFSDRFIPTMMGLQAVVAGPRSRDAARAAARPSLRSLQDAALAHARRGQKKRLGIVDCRSGVASELALDVPPEVASLLDVELVSVRDEGDTGPLPAGHSFLSVQVGGGLGAIVREAFRRLPHEHLWFVTDALTPEPDVLSFVARTVACVPNALVVGVYCVRSADGQMSDGLDGAALLRSIFSSGHFPLSALFIPVQPLREAIIQGALGNADIDGALLGTLALATPGVRLVSMPARIAAMAGQARIGPPRPEAYGKESDWDYVERLATFDAIAAHGNLVVWALAEVAALAEPPPPLMRRAQEIEMVWRAVLQVLARPGSYLKRGLSLAFHYLIRGDIRGLIREARLFRPR